MNRRQFITSTALALPSVTLLGALSTQHKSYRSATSLFSNEEMMEWCNKNGIYYAKDNELSKQFFKNQTKILIFNDPNLFSRDILLKHHINTAFNKLSETKYVIKDIYKSNNQKCIVVDCVCGEEYNE